MDFLNALVVFSNFVFIPALAYGSQLALGALGVTLIYGICLLYTSPSPRDPKTSRMPSSA